MSALKDALKSAQATSNNSTKTPAFYTNEKKFFIREMATASDEVVRVVVAGSEHVPTTTLKEMLATEQDADVLKVLLMNPRTPLKAISDFAEDSRAELFADDEEVGEHIAARANANGS